jgi:hypothetical protein
MSNYAIVENGVVINIIEWDGAEEFESPSGQDVVIIPDDVIAGIGYTYSVGDFIAPAEIVQSKTELIAIANQNKSVLLQQVNNVTAIWQTQLALGIITDTDKSTLTTWMKYAQVVSAIDTSTAPNIAWPNSPVE